MVEPLRHRQTKEADNRYVRPTATAPHLNSTILDQVQRGLPNRLLPLSPKSGHSASARFMSNGRPQAVGSQ